MLTSLTRGTTKRRWKHAPAFFLILVVILIQLFDWSVIQLPRERIDGLIYDLKVKRLPPWPESVTNIQIVDIDEYSLAAVGRMPWSREHFANLTSKLSQLGAIVISFDVLFAEPQHNPAEAVLSQPEVSAKFDSAMLNSIQAQFNYDQHFADAITTTDVILPTLFHRELDTSTGLALQIGALDSQGVLQTQPDLPLTIPTYPGFAGVLPKFAPVARGQGFMNSFEDADGFIRQVALLAQVNGKVYPSLALETFRVYSLVDHLIPQWEALQGKAYLTGLSVGDQFIATDNESKIYIPYRGTKRTFPYTSAANVLLDEINDNRFDQAVVFIGSSATGLADLRSTPVELGFPGVEIQATIFDALITPSEIPYQPEWWREAMLLQLLAIGLLCFLFFPNRTPGVTTGLAVLFLSGVIGLNLLLWFGMSIYLPLFSPLLLTVLLSSYFISRGFFFENKKRRQVKAVFDQYVPPAHIDRILQDPESVNLSGEKKELSVMFSDIRSFTSISESMQAEELKLWLNQFFSPITRVILEHDGTIDKYVGDMVMAFWGAPLDEPKHASKSIAAAFSMLEQLTILNHTFAQRQQPLAQIGIGINTGEMNVGDMGSDFRRSYTVIGDAVNLGSRLEGLTKFYGVDILVSEYTQQQASDYHFCLVDRVKVKGKVKPVTIYAPLAKQVTEKMLEQNLQFNLAIESYFAQEFYAALTILKQLDDFSNPHLLTMYFQRIEHFVANPPPSDWDGSFTHTSK